MKEAYLYEKLENKKVRCQTCSHRCLILPGKRGICGTRENIEGKLYSLIYGKAIAQHLDPIEKKPLFHFLPGSFSLSVATVGCCFRCAWCFPPETVIPTEGGIMTLEEIFNQGKFLQEREDGEVRKIEEIKTFSHQGAKRKILHAFKRNYEGEMIFIKPGYTPEIQVTPHHPFYITRNPKYGKVQKVYAKNLTTSDYLIVPKIYSFSQSITLDLYTILNNYEVYSQVKARKIRINPEMLQKRRNKPLFVNNEIRFKTEKSPYLNRFLPLNRDLAYLLGFYCAEGWVRKCKNRPNSYTLLFAFKKRGWKTLREIKDLIKKNFRLSSRINLYRTTLQLSLGKTSLALLFKHLCGTGVKDKKVPEEIFQAKKEIVKAFLEGYLKGDGYKNTQGEWVINTVSKKLATGIYWLWLKMGYLPRFYIWKSPKTTRIESRSVNQSYLYYVKVWTGSRKKYSRFYENKNYYFLPILEIKRRKYKGFVYNIEVEKDHSYLANFISVGNCQNWEISQQPKPDKPIEGFDLSPSQIVKDAKAQGVQSISYTYTEPSIFLEYALETMKLAKKNNLLNNWVSDGYMTPESLDLISPFLDAINVDLKAFKEETYEKYIGGRLKPVLDNLKEIYRRGIHLEITTLVIPTINDSEEELRQIARFIKNELGKKVPWHISRFFPAYKMLSLPPTLIETLEKAYEIGKEEGLDFVYLGNVFDPKRESTYCPKCGIMIIERSGYEIKVKRENLKVENNRGFCQKCGEDLNVLI